MGRNIKPKIMMLIVYTIFVLLAVFSALKVNDLSLLNSRNSLYISNAEFEPNLSMRKLRSDEEGIHEYRISLKREDFSWAKTDTLVFFLNKVTDNAYCVKLNDIIIGSEGDMKKGHSMFKSNPNHFSFDRRLIQDENLLVISTYATYKTGLESGGVYITDSLVGMQQARKVDFFGTHLIMIGMGCLIFSIVILGFMYYINYKGEIAFLYASIATFFISIYFIDYLKIVYLPYHYLVHKKIIMSALYLAIFFYMLAISDFLKSIRIKYLAGLTAGSFILMSLLINDLVLYKKHYTYWYFALILNIVMGFIYSLAHLKKVRRAFIFVVVFLYASIYASLGVFIEFFDASFSVNSPLVYIVVISALPLLFGMEELANKEEEISYERKQREHDYLNSMTDSLTGAWNQRFLYEKLAQIGGQDTI